MPKCEICENKIASYKCPRCYINYCSLACYRLPIHSQCSEEFYKEWIVSESRGNQIEQRESILDILKRSGQDGYQFDGLEDAIDEVDLHARMAGLDLDRDHDKIWARLTLSEQEEFKAAIASSKILNLIPVWKPWWKYSHQDSSTWHNSLKMAESFQNRSSKSASDLLMNDIATVLFTYCLLCRFFNGEYKKSFRIFSKHLLALCPCFDGNTHRPAQDVASALSYVRQRVLPYDEELSLVLDDQFASKLIKDVHSIMDKPDKSGILFAVTEIISIFDCCLDALPININSSHSTRDCCQNDRQLIFRSKKKMEYFLGWVSCIEETVILGCRRQLEVVAATLKAESNEFHRLQLEIENSEVMSRTKSSCSPKIIELQPNL